MSDDFENVALGKQKLEENDYFTVIMTVTKNFCGDGSENFFISSGR